MWNELRPTLTAITANLAFAPQGVAAVQEQGRQLAEQAPVADGTSLSPAALVKQASQRPGRQLPLQPAALPDQSMSIQVPQGWSLEGQKAQFILVNNAQTRTHGMDSLQDASRSRDYTSHMWSQTTLGQDSWVAENEGARVYHTDSWGIEGPEGRIDSPAYNNTNFTGQNPWGGGDLELIDTRAEYERYIANQ